ncbi:hypothetical protein PVAND_011968 [Polypedilum vanderplanki]|uniref:Odorant receptor n=1 Tax=Polypedilum vanderplanki TaxID=319348 RepID=A0A9J6CK63_POLVA|nr:hypothetical protein PVAND_011968 [Polypedilum vanderplanki]
MLWKFIALKIKYFIASLQKIFLPIKLDENFDIFVPFDYPLKTLKIFGVWTTKDSSWKYFFYSSFIHFTFIEGSVLIQLLYLKDVKNFLDFAILMIILPPCAGIQIESMIVHYNIKKIKLAMKMIRENLEEYCVNENFKRELLKIDKIYKFLLWNVVILVITFPLFSALNHELIALIWTPFDLNIEKNYWIALIYETFVLFVLANIGLVYDILPTIFMVYVSIMLEQLCKRFENIRNQSELVKLIEFQQKIQKIVQILNSIFSLAFFSRGIFSVIIFCTNIFALVLLSDFIVLGRLSAFLFHMLSVIFISCYYSTTVTTLSEKLNQSIFASDWTFENKEFKQIIKVVMEFSKKPIKFRAARMFHMKNFIKTFKKRFLPLKDVNVDIFEPLEIPSKILRTFGMSINKSSSWKHFCYSFIIHAVLLDTTVLLESMYILEIKDFLTFTVWMVTFPPTLGVYVETYNFHFNINNINLLKKKINVCFDEYCVNDYCKKELLTIDKIYKFLLWNVAIFVISFSIFSAINHEMIFRAYSPNLSIDFIYWIFYIYELVVLLSLSLMGLSYDLLPTIFMAYVVILLQQLCKKFENLKRRKHANKNLRTELIKCIKFQTEIFEIIKIINKSFSIAFFSRGFFSVFVFCTHIVAIMLLSDVVILAKLASFVFHMLSTVFISCYYGSKLTDLSNKVSESIIASDWMYEEKEYRVLIKVAMEFNKRPIKIKSSIFFVDLKTFLMICNSAYSMLCLCNHFIGK